MSNLRLYIGEAFPKLSRLPQGVLACGLKPVTAGGLAEARALAEARIGGDVASLSALRRLRRFAPQAILVFAEHGRLTGVLGVLPLTDAGARALLDATLDLAAPRRTDIAPGFETAAALYAMGIAAATGDAARATVTGVVRLRETFPAVPFYARPVTEDGRRVLIERLHCVPVSSTALMVSAATQQLGAAA